MSESNVPVQERPTEDVYAPDNSDLVEQDLFIKSHLDPMRNNTTPGIYLDDESRRAAEVTRARIEGREPDLENPPLYGGDQAAPFAEVAKVLPGDVAAEIEPYDTVLVDKREFNDQGELVKTSDGETVYADEGDTKVDDVNKTPEVRSPEESQAPAKPESSDGEGNIGDPSNEELATKKSEDNSQTGESTDSQKNSGVSFS